MSNKKILLISANRHTIPYPVYPLGLSYLESCIINKLPDFKVKLFDINIHSLNELVSVLQTTQPAYTGISFRNVDDANYANKESFIKEYSELVSLIRNNSKSKLIIGGSGFSIFPAIFFDLLKPDFGIFGEGEESFYRLIECLETGKDYKNIDGLVYQENGTIKLNNHRHYLNTIELYFNNELIDFYWEKSGMLNIQTKRGCPYHCIYCSYPLIEGAEVRTYNTDKIIETLCRLYYDKKVNYVFFTDSVFNIHNDYNKELAEKIIKSGINIKWGAYFSPDGLDFTTFKLYKEAGLKHIEFGTESICDLTLTNYGKHFTVNDIFNASEICNKLGIYFAHFLILAGYSETDATLNETFENSKKINNSVFFPYIGMRIYPGTTLWNLAVKQGIIQATDDLLTPKYYISKNVTLATIKKRAVKTGKKWFFPDEEMPAVIEEMRKRKRKGPLWHLIR
ncbi:MAG: cobalamin B12-binding domain-containing protein [Bacteroidia bacterium]|nr:cobalamin B12-binding domain-containing protein [Bacteroidia bacterium]